MVSTHDGRSAPPVLAKGDSLLKFEKNTYEADKSLKRILEISSRPLTARPIYGRAVTAASLLGKDAHHQGVTFTAQMQPDIKPGEKMELYFRCEELVQMWVVQVFGRPKCLTHPSPYVLVKERNEHGKWIEIGRTESISQTRHPTFARPVIVTYAGPEAVQHIQVNVVSYAYKMRDGIQLGECTLLLDDLVHGRTARVMKLPLLSPTHSTLTNGNIIISGSSHDPAESGTWVQLGLSANHLPWINGMGEHVQDPNKGTSPCAYFEIWQQSSEGEKMVYKSEVSKASNNPDWWPLALNSRKLGAESDAYVWMRMWSQGQASDNAETLSPSWIGECCLDLRELVAGKRVPLKTEGSMSRTISAADSGPQLHIKSCKWIKLSQGARLESQPAYKKDMLFLKDLVEHVDLDAATKESCLSCLQFVNTRSKFWAMDKILADSTQIKASARSARVSTSDNGACPNIAPSSTDTPHDPHLLGLATARTKSDSPGATVSKSDMRSRNLSVSAATHAADYDTANMCLEELAPMSRRRESVLWHEALDALHQRCRSRSESGGRPVVPGSPRPVETMRNLSGALSVPGERKAALARPPSGKLEPAEGNGEGAGHEHDWRHRSLLSSSPAFHGVEESAHGALDTGLEGASETDCIEVSGLNPGTEAETLEGGARVRDQAGVLHADRPRTTHSPSKESADSLKRRPSTAAGGVCLGMGPSKRATWSPVSAKEPCVSGKPQGTLASHTSRPISARSDARFSVRSVFGRATTPAAATAQFRESLRPLLANLHREGSEARPAAKRQ